MFYVYILKSIKFPEKTYVGFTADLNVRLSLHNSGKSIYTAKYMPWELHSYVAFNDEASAIAFEKYLKTGSGKAFIKKHFSIKQACTP
jgi:predicted GIY-YIG superfamily endonuclease